MIGIFTNDEHSQWVATISNNGVATDYSSGYTFTCYVVDKNTGSTLLTKTTGITGAAAGAVTVAFTGAELDGASVTATFGSPEQYFLYLVPRRTADNSDGPTVKETLQVEWRP